MKVLLALTLALVLAGSAGAQYNPEPLYEYGVKFTVWSDVSDGVYWWAVRNESTTAKMLGWFTGAGWPVGTIPRASIIPEAVFPLPTVQPTLPRPWFNAFLSCPLEPLTVESTFYWDDGTSDTALIYMPPDAPMLALVVPEPSGLLALSVGLGGLFAWKRRSRSTGCT